MRGAVTLFVLANDARARLLESVGPGREATEVAVCLRSEMEALRVSYSEGADRVAGNGARRAFEGVAEAEERMRRLFVEDIAALLKERAVEVPFDRLILVAAPSMLARLRAALSDDLKRRLVYDIDRDLVDIHPSELLSHFGRPMMF